MRRSNRRRMTTHEKRKGQVGIKQLHPLLMTAMLGALALFPGCGGKADEGDSGASASARDDPEAASVFAFEDATESSGIRHVYRNGREAKLYTMLETLGGGVAIFDYDVDGKQDLFFTGGGGFTAEQEVIGAPSTLWQARGDAVYEDRSSLIGVDTSEFYTHGTFSADYNQDGFPDLLLTGYGGVRLYTNRGDGSFELETDGGLPDEGWSTCAAWGDVDADGLLDLLIVNYVEWNFAVHKVCERPTGAKGEVCSPRLFEALSDRLLLGQPDGSFVDVTQERGFTSLGKGLGVASADVDLDGDIDFYIANDTTPNFLYLNDGQGNFSEEALLSGCALGLRSRSDGSMGVTIGDYNLDGSLDIGVANFDSESYGIYRQEPGASFFYASDGSGMTDVGQNYVSWGTRFIDLDADGDHDLLINNGHILYFPPAGEMLQQPLLLENVGGRFRRAAMTGCGYLETTHHGRGLAVGDLDGDFRPDLVYTNVNQNAAILLHRSQLSGGRYLHVRLIGTTSNRDGWGAVIRARIGQQERVFPVVAGESFASSSQPGVWLGIPAGEAIKSIEVTWPNGNTQRVAVADQDELLVVEQP